MLNFRAPTTTFIIITSLLNGLLGQAQEDAVPIQTLDPYLVQGGSIANETPLPTYANPISLLSFAPRVDLQSRNFSEAQGDISIRGGTFENTGFTIGGLAIFDPQTGHYLAEIPVDPMMMGHPTVLTGFENQTHGFNANVGSIHYNWNSISTSQTLLTLTLGENALNTQSLYTAIPFEFFDKHAAVDVGIARSESDGSIAYGDHQFSRYSSRLQFRDETSQFNLFAGYQDKFFGWPNMYTPFNVQETEDIQTLLVAVDYSTELSTESTLNVASYYRVNWDDYEFDRDRPGIYNPYEHKTKVAGFHAAWELQKANDATFSLSADAFFDSIDSTTLTHSFQSRTYTQLKAYTRIPQAMDSFQLDLCLSYFDTNRNDASVDAALRLAWDLSSGTASHSGSTYIEYSSGSQVSGYTAVGSATSGLFAGNPTLDIERTHNFEIGYQWQSEIAALQVAAFHRLDRDLTDWTFSFASPYARSANPVDIATTGIEIITTRKWKSSLLTAAYTFLHKTEDYGDGSTEIDASFYALNYPNHRFTLSLAQQLHRKLQLRLDSEYRIQEENALRRSEDNAILAYLSIIFHPIEDLNWDLKFSIENLFDSDFEEIPAVPASRRQFAIQSTLSW